MTVVRAGRTMVAALALASGLAGAAGRVTAQPAGAPSAADAAERWCAPPAARTAEVRAAAAADATLCLTAGERLRLLARQTADPFFYGEVVLSSAWGQVRREPVAWGRTRAGMPGGSVPRRCRGGRTP